VSATNDIVQKLWGLCHVLRDDGITYIQYVTELTYLLFLKMVKETGTESQLPAGRRWEDLIHRDGVAQLDFYRETLLALGRTGSDRVQAIFTNASTALKQPRILKKLVETIDSLDWYSAQHEGLGDLYEGLLEKNASEKKSGTGQYFTPRPLIDSVVSVVKPQPGELIQDPAAGTGGFLVAADRYIKVLTDNLLTLPKAIQTFQRKQAFYGIELVQDAHRLLLINMLLHGIEGNVILGDTLSIDGQRLMPADVILTNPPFGTKRGGGLPSRNDFKYETSNKQLAFLQHIYMNLKPGGRAAVVLPDNVLFENGQGRNIRADLMDKCNLHTILRLPTGIFYAQGVKTNVLFFSRGTTEKGNTKNIWIYDMRANMPNFGKRTPLTKQHFKEFEDAFGEDPLGLSLRVDQGIEGRFRCFTREEIAKRSDNLALSWLRDESQQWGNDFSCPEVIASDIIANLQAAMEEMDALVELLEQKEPTS
jgi:type I restriction enzyme M protein